MREDRKVGQAKSLRKTMTTAERKLWSRLRMRQLDGLRFRRQADFGPYVADFLCHSPALIVELDGGQHVESRRDQVRDAWFAEQGFTTLRFWNPDVSENLDGVLETILAKARELGHVPSEAEFAPLPPRAGGEAEGGSSRKRRAGESVASPHPDPPPQAGEEESLSGRESG